MTAKSEDEKVYTGRGCFKADKASVLSPLLAGTPSKMLEGPSQWVHMVVLKACTSDWDLNLCGRDLNPAKTHSLPTEITHLVSGLNEAQVLDVSSQKEFGERQSDR